MHNALWQLHAVSLCLLQLIGRLSKKRPSAGGVGAPTQCGSCPVAPLHALIIATVVAAAAAAASLGVSVVATVAAAAAAADSITWR